MKIWRTLNRNPTNRCRESCALWSSFPVAYVSTIFLGKLLADSPIVFKLIKQYHYFSANEKTFPGEHLLIWLVVNQLSISTWVLLL